MALSREQIVEKMEAVVGPEQVVTDEEVLKTSSVDRYRKYQELNGVFLMPLPAAVVMVHSVGEVSDVLRIAQDEGINVVPRTGDSATEGGLETAVKDSIVLDGSGMNQILRIDTVNMQATAQCGVPLEVLEEQLREEGFTTGHSPQSKPLAQMGGLTATRSIGQLSTLYGGMEDMLVGGEAVFPGGEVCRIKNVPRRSAGPDIRHILLGNEGALCFITEVTVKIFPYLPENNRFYGYLLEDMQTGFEILREVMVQGYKPSVARLYDPEDGDYHFSHFSEGKCVLIFVAEGPAGIAEATGKAIEQITAGYPECRPVDGRLIKNWFENLNWDPAKIEEERQEIRETGNMGFTTEVSAGWGEIHAVYEASIRRIKAEVPDLTLVGGHSSHSYINGTNLYFVYYYNLVDVSPEEEIAKYHDPIQNIIVEETLKRGGSMCHHHGVGKHRTHFIEEEYGSSLSMLQTLKRAFDPRGIMNAGTILPLPEGA